MIIYCECAASAAAVSDPYIYSHLPFIPAGIVTLSTRGLVDQCQLSRVNDVNSLFKNEQHFKRTVPKLGYFLKVCWALVRKCKVTR